MERTIEFVIEKREKMKKALFAIMGVIAAFVSVASGVYMAAAPFIVDGKFKELTKEQRDNLTEEEAHAYTIAKLNHEMSELKAKHEALEAEKDDAKLTLLQKEVESMKEDQIKTMQAAIDMQGTIIEKLRKGDINANQVLNANDAITKAYNDQLDAIKSTVIEDGKSIRFEVKAAGDMTLAGNVTGTMPQAERLEGVNDIALRTPRTYELVPKLRTSGNTIEWVYETSQDGTIDGTAEGNTKDQIDNDFVVTSVSLLKRAAYMKVSTEMLTDVTFMQTWLRNKLVQHLFLDVDDQILNGNNTGQNLNGIINRATAFSAGVHALTVDNANEVDVLVAAVDQIEVANQDVNGLAIVMHPSDVAQMKFEKVSSTDKRYVERVTMVAGSLLMDGIPIIKNNNISQGTYLVGDMSKALIAEKDSIMFEIGLDGNDFTKNMRTMLAEWRGQLIIQNNDTTAFVTGTFSTDAAALETT